MLTRILFVVHFFEGLLFSVPVLSDVAISIGIYGKSETFNISSVITEDKHEISVYLPPGYHSKSEEKYPVLVLLDSNLLFGHARSAINLFAVGGTIKPPVLVGIGYLEDDFDTFTQIRSHYFASAAEKNGEGAKHDQST